MSYDFLHTGSDNRVILRLSFAGLFMQSAGLGLQICLSIQSLSAYLSSPREVQRARKIYIYILFLILALSVVVMVFDGISTVMIVELLSYPDGRSPSIWVKPLWSWIPRTTALGLIQVLGDGLLLWRCYILWRDRRWIVLFPLVIYLASIALGFIYFAKNVAPISAGVVSVNYDFMAAYFLSVAVLCLLTTILIAIRLVGMEKDMQALPIKPANTAEKTTPYTRALVVLIESALPFTLFGILVVVSAGFASLNPRDSVANAMYVLTPLWIWTSFCVLGQALAPQLIIYRVMTGRSWANTLRSVFDNEKGFK
ncbi:hypothetical protein FA15DRAFT_758843 [Coprinopsis marcescibilis]|uniref:Uncharacterized protein n=1 Tax=Coprinopsis marcescibilis TaxID=230819 RepID=A0A5C3KZA2_COPMA|nr:hypothetical protein FA15DRAFT_758843 [Coprinopsis marcescibilis]